MAAITVGRIMPTIRSLKYTAPYQKAYITIIDSTGYEIKKEEFKLSIDIQNRLKQAKNDYHMYNEAEKLKVTVTEYEVSQEWCTFVDNTFKDYQGDLLHSPAISKYAVEIMPVEPKEDSLVSEIIDIRVTLKDYNSPEGILKMHGWVQKYDNELSVYVNPDVTTTMIQVCSQMLKLIKPGSSLSLSKEELQAFINLMDEY